MKSKVNLQSLENIDWEFSDYRGFHSFPADLNSLHWYPAPFVPHIPAIIIQALSKPNDTILDIFAGSGVTLIEAAKLRRKFIGVDINPFAINIVKSKFEALSVATSSWAQIIKGELNILKDKKIDSHAFCDMYGISHEVFSWFHKDTLTQLLIIHEYLTNSNEDKLLKRTIFSAILNKACAQREHYTYITDGCYPKEANYIDAYDLFINQVNLTASAAEMFRKQYLLMHNKNWEPLQSQFAFLADSRDVSSLNLDKVDLVVTSPPYLGVNDYVRSMRLTKLFFALDDAEHAYKAEIGARRKRSRQNAYREYIDDMDKVFGEVSRVLKPEGFFVLVIGKGRGRVNKRDAVEELLSILADKYFFKIIKSEDRTIKFRRIQVKGVDKEKIIILKRQ